VLIGMSVSLPDFARAAVPARMDGDLSRRTRWERPAASAVPARRRARTTASAPTP